MEHCKECGTAYGEPCACPTLDGQVECLVMWCFIVFNRLIQKVSYCTCCTLWCLQVNLKSMMKSYNYIFRNIPYILSCSLL